MLLISSIKVFINVYIVYVNIFVFNVISNICGRNLPDNLTKEFGNIALTNFQKFNQYYLISYCCMTCREFAGFQKWLHHLLRKE